MSRRTRSYWVLALSGLFAAAGCGDPVRTTVQPVRLRVVDSRSAQPVVGVQLLLKNDFERMYPLAETELTREEWERRKIFWDQQPWFRAAPKEDGIACIDVVYTQLDRSWGSKPPADRDRVTGNPFIVRVRKGPIPSVLRKLEDWPEERVSLVMESGQSAKAKTVTVTVLDIQPPRYVDVNEAERRSRPNQ